MIEKMAFKLWIHTNFYLNYLIEKKLSEHVQKVIRIFHIFALSIKLLHRNKYYVY